MEQILGRWELKPIWGVMRGSPGREIEREKKGVVERPKIPASAGTLWMAGGNSRLDRGPRLSVEMVLAIWKAEREVQSAQQRFE